MPKKELDLEEALYSWSKSVLGYAGFCMMQWWIKKIERIKGPRLPHMEIGIFWHKLLEDFWTRNGTELEVLNDSKGNSLSDKKRRELNKESKENIKIPLKKKYHNEETFAKYATGKFYQVIIGDKDSSRGPIKWAYGGEPYEIKRNIEKFASPLYETLVKEGPPLFSELSFNFNFGDYRFTGRIDEVRLENGKPVVRDFKTGKIDNLEFEFENPIYNLGLQSLAKKDEKFAKLVKLEHVREELMGNPTIISKDILHEYFGVFSRKINRIEISDFNYKLLIDRLKNIENRVREGNIDAEISYKCKSCDVIEYCHKNLKKQEELSNLDNLFPESPITRIYTLPISISKSPNKQKLQQKTFAWGRGKNTSKGRLPKDPLDEFYES